jgi:hypothetical protein
MTLTLDHNQLQTALDNFGIEPDDYYLLCEPDVIYMLWCTMGAKAYMYTANDPCVAMDIKGTWYYYGELPENYTFATPNYVCLRYILQTT